MQPNSTQITKNSCAMNIIGNIHVWQINTNRNKPDNRKLLVYNIDVRYQLAIRNYSQLIITTVQRVILCIVSVIDCRKITNAKV